MSLLLRAFIFFLCFNLNAQKLTVKDSLIFYVLNYDLDKALRLSKRDLNITENGSNQFVENYVKFLIENDVSFLRVDTILLNARPTSKNYNSIIFQNLILADKLYGDNIEVHSESHEYYIKAFKTSMEFKDTMMINLTFNKLITPLFKRRILIDEIGEYLEIVRPYKANSYFLFWHEFFETRYQSILDKESKANLFLGYIDELKSQRLNFILANFYQHIAIHYYDLEKNYDLAEQFYLKAAKIYESIPHKSINQYKFQTYANLGIVKFFQKKYGESISLFDKAEKMTISNKRIDYIPYLREWQSKAYLKKLDYQSAFRALKMSKELGDSLTGINNDLKTQEIETKYQTAEKEKQILIEKQRATTNRNWLIAAGLALVFGTGIAILLQKNTRKKRELAEQKTQLEQQKVQTLLKEQELVSIDAMIAGQEKERQKVANELHDDLGSLMATVKLHFDNVKASEKDPALMNAQKLLDEAYQKIRGMAHSKNSGVMANQGLLPAVQKMAKTINETNALKVTVEDYGLADRMENSLELNIFRMLQELVTNIIKHSEAKKATIQFTQHEDKLNIIVEDDGKGFDISEGKTREYGYGLGHHRKEN